MIIVSSFQCCFRSEASGSSAGCINAESETPTVSSIGGAGVGAGDLDEVDEKSWDERSGSNTAQHTYLRTPNILRRRGLSFVSCGLLSMVKYFGRPVVTEDIVVETSG
jgi:hypothetical protein